MSDNEFEKNESGSLTYPTTAGNIKKGGHILIKGFPCKVVDVSTSKTGKHGHAKANITAIDIFTGKKMETSEPTSHNVDVPNVSKTEYELISIEEDDYVTLLTEEGEYKTDLKIEEEDENYAKLKEQFEKGANIVVCVISAMGQEKIISFREEK